MRKLIAAAVVIIHAGTLHAAYAHDECVHMATTGCGTVETVREIAATDPVGDLFEHRVHPDMARELVIRTDDGGTVVLRQLDLRQFSPGQRVRLISGGAVPRLELP